MSVQTLAKRNQIKETSGSINTKRVNDNKGGIAPKNPKINNMDAEKGFIDNSHHAIYRKNK